MDRWFSQQIEDTLESALELSRFHYEEIFQRHMRIGSRMVDQIEKKDMIGNEKELQGFSRKVRDDARSWLSGNI